MNICEYICNFEFLIVLCVFIYLEYEEVFCNPLPAARRGFIDDVITPSQTRRILIEGNFVFCFSQFVWTCLFFFLTQIIIESYILLMIYCDCRFGVVEGQAIGQPTETSLEHSVVINKH